MSDSDSRIWLSTWLDGETPADERSAVERRFADDPGAQRDLEQFRELGSLLRSLPTHAAPAGFSSVVMARCERESLFAGDAATPASSTKPISSRPRSTVAIAVSILATAAMLFLLVQVVSPPGTPTRDKRNSDESPRTDKLAAADAGKRRSPAASGRAEKSAELFRDSSTAAPAAPTRDKSAVTATAAAKAKSQQLPKFAGPAEKRSLAGPTPDKSRDGSQPTAGARRIGGSAPAGAGFGGAAAKSMRFDFGNRPAGIRVGEVVPYLQVSGDRTAVIEVTVIDVNQAVGRLEVLLERKLVKPLSAAPRQSLSTKASAESKLLMLRKGTDREAKPELIAVYVESTQAQLAQVMRELDRETQSLHVSLRPPVALGDVQLKSNGDGWANLFRRDRRRAPRTLADAADFGRRAVVLQSDKKADDNKRSAGGVSKDEAEKGKQKDTSGKPSSQKKDADSAVPKATKRSGGKKSAADRGVSNAAESPGSRSFQLRLKLTERPMAVGAGDQNQKPAQSRHKESDPAATRDPLQSRPVQVMFVFRAKQAPVAPVPARRP